MTGYLIAALGAVAMAVASFFYGQSVGEDNILASQAREDKLIEKVNKAIDSGVAAGVAQIKVTNQVVNNKAQTIIREKQVMVDCKSGPELVDLFNRQQPVKVPKQ